MSQGRLPQDRPSHGSPPSERIRPARALKEKPSSRARAEHAKLLVHEFGKEERIVELSARISTIGRSHENTIEIDDLSSSRRHCQIERRDRVYEIVDLKSRNGTLVNGILVLRKELRPGDCIEVGKTRMYFEYVSAGRPEETIDLTTGRFLVPLDEIDAEDPFDILKKEREVFLKLLDFTRQLNSKAHLADLYEFVVDTVVEVSGCERGALFVIDSDGVRIVSSRSVRRETVREPEAKLAVGAVDDAIRDRKSIVASATPPILASDATENESSVGADGLGETGLRDIGLKETGLRAVGAKTTPLVEAWGAAKLGIQSLIVVPVMTGESPIAAIYADHRFAENAFGDDHRRWLELVANQVSVALRTAQLFEENRDRQVRLEAAQEGLERVNLDLEDRVLSKSLQLEEVMKLIPRERPRDFKHDYNAIVTRSPKMFDIFRLIDKVTESSVPVLILGESGTGKELIARAIHQNGPRAAEAFVSENCAAIPINLMESEFFGHVRGAFTGATRDKRGLFEVAHGGTLFLDEIADMPPSMQTKLLRVLQEGEIRRVGGKEMIRVNVRIISATNKNIYDMVRRAEFREDLVYRINVITITLPPLRERREDIPLLIDHFLNRIAERSGEKKIIDRDTFHLLYQYDWPGNVRELENEIERLAALSGEHLEAQLLSPNIQARARKRGVPIEGSTLKEVVARTVEDVEAQVIRSTLLETNWKKSKAAEVLGISRPTLDAKIEKYKLAREGSD
jgi:transcriptional regulator with GAF, ATPase, and Fis domain